MEDAALTCISQLVGKLSENVRTASFGYNEQRRSIQDLVQGCKVGISERLQIYVSWEMYK